jgi:hypothetical protein
MFYPSMNWDADAPGESQKAERRDALRGGCYQSKKVGRYGVRSSGPRWLRSPTLKQCTRRQKFWSCFSRWIPIGFNAQADSSKSTTPQPSLVAERYPWRRRRAIRYSSSLPSFHRRSGESCSSPDPIERWNTRLACRDQRRYARRQSYFLVHIGFLTPYKPTSAESRGQYPDFTAFRAR